MCLCIHNKLAILPKEDNTISINNMNNRWLVSIEKKKYIASKWIYIRKYTVVFQPPPNEKIPNSRLICR